MAQVFYNNVAGLLSGTHSAVTTTLTLQAGHNCPDPGANYYLATLILLDSSARETAWEIVRVTDVTGNVLTVTRGQESTTAREWAGNSRIEVRLTAGATESKANLGTAAYTDSAAYQPVDADLIAIAALAKADSNFIVGNGTAWVAESGATARASLGLGTAAIMTGPVGDIVGTSDSQALTNKDLSADSNTISGLAASSFVLSNASGNLAGGVAQKVIPAGAVVGTTDTQTLTNKTLDNPTITGAPVLGYSVLTDAAGVVIDPHNGATQFWTVGANRTPVATGWDNGQRMILMVRVASASYAVSWTHSSFGAVPGINWLVPGPPSLQVGVWTAVLLWKSSTDQVFGATLA